MSTEVIVALITAIPTVTVAAVSVVNANRIISFKIDDLEKKVDKHNNLIERTFVLETKAKATDNRLDELHEDIKEIEKEVRK